MKNYVVSQIYVVAILFVFLSSCTPKAFVVDDFSRATLDHVTVAVLPFRVNFEGNLPKEITREQLQMLLVREAELFQTDLHAQLLTRRMTDRGQPIAIDLQPLAVTRGTLEENDLMTAEVWTKNPADLARLLGVDAVITGEVTHYRLMSDLVSAGIELGRSVLFALGYGGGIPAGLSNNKEVYASYAIIDADSERLLWSYRNNHEADWSRRADEIVHRINRQAARQFPYR